jgi:hypothetical protein
VHRELPGLAELTVADGEQPLLKVHVVPIEPDRFAFSHAFSRVNQPVA